MKSPSGQDHTESRMIEAIFAFSLGPFQSLLFSHVNDLNKVSGSLCRAKWMSDSRSATTNISQMTRHLSRSLKYAGKDLGTMLEVGPEEDEEAAPDEETLATEECKRSHSRFTACENNALCGLLSARGHVPAKREFIEWVKRQGTGMFVGRTLASIRSTLHHLGRKRGLTIRE